MAPAETWAGSSWDGFIRQVLPEQAVRDYLQELAGVALVGEVLAQVFVFAYGHGANGKSVFFDVIGELLGDYAGTVGSQAVMSGNMQQKELIYGRFVGKRLVVMQELNEGDQMDEATVKALTGGDRLDARTLYHQGGNLKPQHSLFMAGNHMPALPSGGGESIWRRMKVIHFGVQVPPEQQDPLLKEKLLEDGPCVLAWLVEGCRRFLERGRLPVDPAPVAEATRRYRLAADPFAAFMAGALVFEPGAAVMVSQVREAFGEYVGALGLAGAEWKNNEYPRRLRNAGAEVFRTANQRGYKGLAVRPHSEWDYHEE